MTFIEGGNTLSAAGRLCQLFCRQETRSAEDSADPSGTFQDVDALLVGWVGVWVVRGREHATVDVAHPCATVVLTRDLPAMFARWILKQKGRGETNGWVIELSGSMRE